jgi:hypothetical protein
MTQPPERLDAVKQVTEVLGAIAGIAALIYVAGGAIYYVRLSMYGIEGLTVIGSLPREFLISVGLLGFAGPWLLGICAYLVGGLWWVPDADAKQRRIIDFTIPVTLAVAGVVVATRFDGMWSAGLLSLLIVSLVIFVALYLTIARVDAETRRTPATYFKQPAALFRRAALQGLLLAPAGLTLAAGLPLQQAAVCPSTTPRPVPAALKGRFLGQSKDRVWLAEVSSKDRGNSRIASIPTSNTSRVYVYAPSAEAPAC